jgi:hypothetical protein
MRFSRADFHQRLLPILCAQAVGLLCGLVGVRLTSALVAPADYGMLGVFATLAPVGASVVWIGLIKYTGRHWAESADRPGLLRAVLAAGMRKLPWLAAGVGLLAAVAAPDHRLRFGLLLLAAATLLALTQLGQTALQAMRAHWRDCGVSAGISLLRSFLPPLLYAATGAGLVALLGGFTLHALAGATLAAVALRPWWRAGPGGTVTVHPVYEGPQFATLAIAGWVVAGVNRWLVAGCFGAETAGYFTLAGNIGIILPAMAGLVLQQYLQPDWFATGPADSAGLVRRIDRTAAGYTVFALAVTGALHLLMPVLIGPLISVGYTPAATFILATGCFATALTVGNFYHVLLLAVRREPACLPADLAGAAVLFAGSVVTALLGLPAFKAWLLASPLVPWVVNRPLALAALRRAAP